MARCSMDVAKSRLSMLIMRNASSRNVRRRGPATTLRDNHLTVEPAASGPFAEPRTLARHPAKARHTRSRVMAGTLGISYPEPDQLG